MLFFTLGVGVDVVVYDRIGTSDGFGLFSPFGVVTAGVEVAPECASWPTAARSTGGTGEPQPRATPARFDARAQLLSVGWALIGAGQFTARPGG